MNSRSKKNSRPKFASLSRLSNSAINQCMMGGEYLMRSRDEWRIISVSIKRTGRRLRIENRLLHRPQNADGRNDIFYRFVWRVKVRYEFRWAMESWWLVVVGFILGQNQIICLLIPTRLTQKNSTFHPKTFRLPQYKNDAIQFPRKKLSTSHASERKTNDLPDNNQAPDLQPDHR